MDDEKNNKNIEIVQGIGNLDISPVYENTTSAKPKMKDEKPKDIVIPQVKKHVEKINHIDEEQNIDENDDNDDNDDNEEDEEEFEDEIQFDDFDDLNSDDNNNE